ncbi:hypothetical protein [Streptomyces sp. WMMC1477]|uniref:hypothetical protein n=1 Tax=Streptomyces sp. WMMC1477 TaxID=3015155 RepID=UPI0022B64C2C|nr:hypothetical protein [Streptomyces sp. WMMC1477]MCZ7430123.1 hypothetical protein [Streptomyces sp. WMMC1477]
MSWRTTVIGTGLTKNDHTPERTYTASSATGPVLADITCPDGVVHVTIDPAAEVAQVRVRTTDPDGPAAEAVRDTRISQSAERLTVVVPPLPPTTGQFNGGGVFIGGNSYSSITVNGTTTVFGGRGGTVINGTTGVEVLVTLPAGSGVKYRSENGSLYTYGVLAALQGSAVNGSIHAENVGRIEAEASNGSIKVGTVTEWIDAESSNGSVKVDQYAGSAAQVRSGNGSIAMTVAPAAAGRIVAKAGNGSVKLYGVRNRGDLDVRATAGNGTVRKH